MMRSKVGVVARCGGKTEYQEKLQRKNGAVAGVALRALFCADQFTMSKNSLVDEEGWLGRRP